MPFLSQRPRGFRLLQLMCALILFMSLLPLSSVLASTTEEPAPIDSRQGAATASANVNANVRGGPGSGFWIVGTLRRFEIVPILGVSPDKAWWLVRGAFGDGWVSVNDVTATNTQLVPVSDPGIIVVITGAVLNVRGGAGNEALILGRLSAGQQVLLIGRSDNGQWLNIQWAFGTGWIAARYTSIGDAAPTVDPEAFAEAPVTEPDSFAIVNASSLNLRAGPNVNFAVIGILTGGERLPILGRNEDGTWFNVQTVFGEGWVSARYVITRNEFGNAPVTTDTVIVDSSTFVGPRVIINTGSLNIRSGPGSEFTILGIASGGDEFPLLARNASFTWVQIRTSVGVGWVNQKYVILSGDTSGLAISSATTPVVVIDPATGEPVVDPDTGQPVTEVTSELTGPIAFVGTGTLNIRSGPNIGFESIGTVQARTRMSIIGQSADRRWWKVDSPFGAGWVNKKYVLVEGNASSVPVVQ